MTEDQENQSSKYHLGDMLWGRVSGHPWWPCMVARGPDSPSSFRTIKRRQNIQVQYHVQYFGEENERGWIGEASLMPYEGRAAFEKLQEEKLNPNTGGNPSKKDRQNFVIAFRRQKSWSTAVVQAEQALALSLDERLERYTFAYPALTEDQQTPKSISPRKRKRLSSSRSSIDPLDSLNGFPRSSQSESLIETQEGEMEEGNNTDSSSAAVSLAHAGVRSGRAIKHTSRFAKHLQDIMKKKSRNTLQKLSTPSNSQDSSLNTSNSRDLPVDAPVIKVDRSEQSPTRQVSQSLKQTATLKHVPPLVIKVSPYTTAVGAAMTGVNNHEAPIKIEPVSDPFMEAQMLHLQQQQLLLQNHHQFQQQMSQLPKQNQQHSCQQKQSFPVISVEPLNSERDDNLQHAKPPKKRQKVNHVFGQKVILITPIPEMQDEPLSIKEPVVPVIIQPTLTSCSVAVNTDIDMECLDRMLNELADRGLDTQNQPTESTGNGAEQPMEVETCDNVYCTPNASSSKTEGAITQNEVNNISGESHAEEHLINRIDEVENHQNTNSSEAIVDSSVVDLGLSDSVLEAVDEDVDMQANILTSHSPMISKSTLEEETVDNTKEVDDTTRDDMSLTSAEGHTMENLKSTNDIDARPTTGDDNLDSQEQPLEETDSLQSEEVIASSNGTSTPMSEEDTLQSYFEEEDHRYTKSSPKPTMNASDSVVISPLYGVMLRASPRHIVKPVEVVIEEVLALTPTKRICHHCNCRGEDLVECQGPCRGIFHPSCLGVSISSQGPIKCGQCTTGCHSCFICKTAGLDLVACSARECGKFYHKECLSKVSLKGATTAFTNGFANSFTCPRHMCLTCAMETGKNNGRVAKGAMYKCLKCPKSYHANHYCLPASCEVIDGLDIVCQAHLSHTEYRKCAEFSCDWCAVCFEGDKFNETPDLIINHKKKQYQGCRPNESLFTCSTCPLSFHPSCYKVSPCTDAWSCKECISGKTVCYGDIVWAKMSNYRWWPGRVLPSNELKDKNHNFVSNDHSPGDVAVHFYGLKLVLQVPWYRLLRFDDGEHLSRDYAYRHLTNVYETAVSVANTAHENRTNQKKNELLLDQKSGSRPAPYKHVKTNIPLGGVELMKVPPSESPVCHCVPDEQGFFCGPDSDCINRLMLYECHPMICHGQSKCLNQRFSKRQDANIKPKNTQEKGWGLFAQSPIEKGQFIGEYVGDLIDSKECKRRLEEAQINGIKNFYMLTLDKNRIIDAGPKGNHTRFMNHSCEPNCETQKWTVCGDIRVGLFALEDIPAGTELNFNYNLDCFGNEKTKCKCGSSICSGFLGVRPKTAVAAEIERKSQETKLRREQALVLNQQLKKRGRKPKLTV